MPGDKVVKFMISDHHDDGATYNNNTYHRRNRSSSNASVSQSEDEIVDGVSRVKFEDNYSPHYYTDPEGNGSDTDYRADASSPTFPLKYKGKQPHSSYVDLADFDAVQVDHNRYDLSDPYSRRNRLQPSGNVHRIDPQFIFKKRDHHTNRSHPSMFSLGQEHNNAHHNYSNHHNPHDSLTKLRAEMPERQHVRKAKSRGSSLDLRRFFKTKKGDKKDHSDHKKSKRSEEPISPNVTGYESDDHSDAKNNKHLEPFSEEHPSLTEKYGSFGKVLGTGASGSVRVITRDLDGKAFAVKQFRPRLLEETKREYAKKITAEFCIGSALHHPNIIETLDIFNNGEEYFEVMQFAPYDMFATVMTGKMTHPEIYCCFKQLLCAIAYLHNLGLAHRDIKLDNLCLDAHGIVKLIDFGSAFVFRYPFEHENLKASGVVGSDPYLAPEVFIQREYNPTAADIWSAAMVFCSMYLRKFPWKVPKVSDNSFRLFSLPSSATEKLDSNDKPIVSGPRRLLRLLPEPSRIVIGQMLLLNPSSRATIVDVLRDPWIDSVQMCMVQRDGSVYNCDNHTHTLKAAE